MGMLDYLYESICHPNLPPCGVATTPNCGVLQQIPTATTNLELSAWSGRPGNWTLNIKHLSLDQDRYYYE